VPKPPFLSLGLTDVCPLDHEGWRVAIDKIFNLGILEVGKIPGEFVIDRVKDNNPHVQFKQQIKPISHPQAIDRTRVR
jgi:hypothetical protein